MDRRCLDDLWQTWHWGNAESGYELDKQIAHRPEDYSTNGTNNLAMEWKINIANNLVINMFRMWVDVQNSFYQRIDHENYCIPV